MSQPLTDNPTSAATTSLANLCPYDRAAITAGIVAASRPSPAASLASTAAAARGLMGFERGA